MEQQQKQPGIAALQHFYVAVGTAAAKMGSLIELLLAIECAGPLSMVICCGSRDVLDGVAVALQSLNSLSLWCLHSDLSQRAIDAEVQSFRRACEAIAAANSQTAVEVAAAEGVNDSEETAEIPADGGFPPLCALLTTDVPLRAVSKDFLPLAPTLLINFDIPVRKEDYVRRMASVLGGRARAEGQRLAIYFTEAGRVVELQQLEVFAEREVKEMPVHVADVFQGGK